MATSSTQTFGEPFTSELINEFGGPEELLSCLESLSQKLHRMWEYLEEETGELADEPSPSKLRVLLASDDLMPALLQKLAAIGRHSDDPAQRD